MGSDYFVAFGYSWGPCSWILVAEIWPLSIRGKGVSIAASSNWVCYPCAVHCFGSDASL